jgi:TRAP-type transport system periplasmic protein
MQQSNTRAWQWRFLTMATIAATLCFFAGSVCAQTYKGPALTLTMASGTNKNIARGKQWNHFAELVEQMTAGKVKVRVFYDGALYGEQTAIEAVLNNSIDIGTSANRQYAPFTNAMLWMDMPYVIDDQAGLRKLVDGGPGDGNSTRTGAQATPQGN